MKTTSAYRRPEMSMRMQLLTCSLLICPGLPAVADHHETPEAERPHVDVYLLAGQSNMEGMGRSEELSDEWRKPIDGLNIGRRFGPELGFVHALRTNAPDTPIYIIKIAYGGQPLDAGWDGGAENNETWVGPEPGPGRMTFYPGTSADDPNVGVLYQRMMGRAQHTMKWLRSSGKEPVLRGIVWMQGEMDAKHKVSAGRYDQSLALLMKRIEGDLNNGKPVPFVFGQVLAHDPPLKRFIARDLIRQRMAEADWRSKSKGATDNVWMVPTEGMELFEDTVHFSTKGQLMLGQAFGLAVLQGQQKITDEMKEETP